METSHPFHVKFRFKDDRKKRASVLSPGKVVQFDQGDPRVYIDAIREAPRHIKITLVLKPNESAHSQCAIIRLGIISLSFNVDSQDDSGAVEHGNKGQDKGGGNSRAIVINHHGVPGRHLRRRFPAKNSATRRKDSESEREIMTRLVIRSRGPRPPRGWTLHLSCPNKDMQNSLCFYRKNQISDENEQIFGANTDLSETPDLGLVHCQRLVVWAKCEHAYENSGNIPFSCPLKIDMVLKYRGTVFFTESLKCLPSPFIIPSTTQPAVNVYLSLKGVENHKILQALGRITQKNTDLKFSILQTEGLVDLKSNLMFGYTESPGITLPIMLSSVKFTDPVLNDVIYNSDRNLQICHIHNGRDILRSILPTPPIYPQFPLGCLLVADNLEMNNSSDCQIPQPLIRICLDWMLSPDVRSIVNFIPVTQEQHLKGFKVVMPSTMKMFRLLKKLQRLGLGDAYLFEGKCKYGNQAEVKIKEILDSNHTYLWEESYLFQEFVDHCRQILSARLGLSEEDFIDLPMMWSRSTEDPHKAVPYMPNATNMIVVGQHAVLPRLYGPVVNGVDTVEERVQEELESRIPKGQFHFVESWTDGVIYSIDSFVTIQRQQFSSRWWEIDENVHL
ncbi:protein-arginine deiminase type-3-like isoform X2 [Ptychodera flava]